MKKLVFLSLLLTLLASAVFAQVADGISIGAWGRGAFAPFIGVGERKVPVGATDGTVDAENFVGTGVTWGDTPAYRFDVIGSSDYVGFGIGIASDGGIGGNDTGAHVWAKPFSNDWLKLTVGNFNDDKLRGKIGSVNGGFEYFVLGLGGEEDAIFTRFNGAAGHDGGDYSNFGFLLSSAPVEGLYIGAALHAPNLWEYATFGAVTPTGTQRTVKESFKRIQLGLGYEIANVGLVRAQFIGGETNGDDALAANGHPTNGKDLWGVFNDPARIEAAFAFTGAEGLTLDVGLKFWLPVKAEYSLLGTTTTATSNNGLGLSLGASFNSGAFGITGRVDTGFASGVKAETKIDATGITTAYEYTGPFTLNFHLVPSFDLGFATVGLDLGLAMGSETKTKVGSVEADGKDSAFLMGFGAFIAKGLGNGSIKAGLAYTLPASEDSESKYYSGVFSVPVILEYSF